MDIDFTKQIADWKQIDVLNKPFPTGNGYALFSKNEEGNFIKILFSSQEHIKNYLNDLGYDWGNEGKDEYRNFDCEHRLIKVIPELSGVESVAADPQWDPDKLPKETMTKHDSSRKMEDMPHLAVELREVDHPIHYDDRTHASGDKKKLPPWMNKDKKDDKKGDKKGDKKDDKKGDKKGDKKKLPPWMNKDKKDDKKGDKKGDKEEKGKDGKKLPPWLMKKKSKSKDYSELYRKVTDAQYDGPLKVGDNVKNINKKCTHFGSEGIIKKFNDVPGDKGVTIAYKCTNAGKNWNEGDVLDKTPDQLEKKD